MSALVEGIVIVTSCARVFKLLVWSEIAHWWRWEVVDAKLETRADPTGDRDETLLGNSFSSNHSDPNEQTRSASFCATAERRVQAHPTWPRADITSFTRLLHPQHQSTQLSCVAVFEWFARSLTRRVRESSAALETSQPLVEGKAISEYLTRSH